MNFARMIAVSDVILRGHILNWFWRDRRHRHNVRSNVTGEIIPRYFKRYLPAAAAVVEEKPIKNDKGEKIFSMWLQGEDKAPDLVKACFRSIRKNCKQELIVLDENTVFDYITLPEEIIAKYRAGKIKRAHFADICRVELLYEHGGIWLDATGFATAPIPDWIIKEDFFVYMAGDTVGAKYSFMQNCFIRARKGAYLLAAWRAMIFDYWMHENHNFDYFMHQLLFKTMVQNDPRSIKYFEKMPHVDQDPTHALWWSIRDKKFDQDEFDKVTSGAFFQKTTYRNSDKLIPGSTADVMVNHMYKD